MKPLVSPLILGTALMFSINTPSHAQPGQHGGMGPQRMMQVDRIMGRIETLAETLDVSDAQLDQMFALIDSQRATVRTLVRDTRQNRKALKDVSDPSEVAAIAEQIGDQTAELIVIGHQARRDLLAILTEEQRAQLESLRAERRDRFRSRRG